MKDLKFNLFFLLSLFTITNLHAQINDFKESNALRRESIQKYLAKDFEGFLRSTQKASRLRKNHPSLIYNTAIGYALTNKPDSAILYLNMLADMKLYYAAENDSDFISLWSNGQFKNIVKKFNSAKEHHGESEFVFSLPEKDLLTESVAYNPITETFYVGSVHKRKIFSVTPNTKASTFAESGDFDFGGVFGIKVDAKNNLLWACTGYLPQTENFTEDKNGISEAVKFDLSTGKVLNKYKLPDGIHLFGDLVVDSKGNVYVSDSRDNNIYLIRSGSDKIEPFLISDNFASLQGIDFSPEEEYLFVADYAMGLYKINMETKDVSVINIPHDLTDLGLDGLYFYKNSLIGIQNGVNPQRVIKMNLDNNYENITSWKVIESNNKYFFEPTLGVLNGDEFYYIANSQWPNFKDDGTVASEEELHNPVVLKTKLK